MSRMEVLEGGSFLRGSDGANWRPTQPDQSAATEDDEPLGRRVVLLCGYDEEGKIRGWIVAEGDGKVLCDFGCTFATVQLAYNALVAEAIHQGYFVAEERHIDGRPE